MSPDKSRSGAQSNQDGKAGLLLNLKDKVGHCRVCGTRFLGPSNRKYCDAHSPAIKYRGRL